MLYPLSYGALKACRDRGSRLTVRIISGIRLPYCIVLETPGSRSYACLPATNRVRASANLSGIQVSFRRVVWVRKRSGSDPDERYRGRLVDGITCAGAFPAVSGRDGTSGIEEGEAVHAAPALCAAKSAVSPRRQVRDSLRRSSSSIQP